MPPVYRKTAIFLKYISKDDGTFFYHIQPGNLSDKLTTYTHQILQPILYVNIQTTQNTFESYQIILTPDLYKNPTKFEIHWSPQTAYDDNPGGIATAVDIIRKYNPLATAAAGITLADADAAAVAAVRGGANSQAIRVGELTCALDVAVLTVPQNPAAITTATTDLTTAKTALQTYANSLGEDRKYIAAIISSNLNILADDTLATNYGANIQAAAAGVAAITVADTAAVAAKAIIDANAAVGAASGAIDGAVNGGARAQAAVDAVNAAVGAAAITAIINTVGNHNTDNTIGSASGLQIPVGGAGSILVSIDQLPHHTAYNLRPTLADIAKLKYRLKALGNIFGSTKTITNSTPIQGGGNKSRRRKRYTQKNIIE